MKSIVVAFALIAGCIGCTTDAIAQAAASITCDRYYFALRSDFNDLGPLPCPYAAKQAQGASASATYNELTHQESVSIDGLAALAFRQPGDYATFFHGLSAGLFVQEDATYLFQPTATQSKTSDTITSGAYTQIALRDPFLRYGAEDLFRFRGGQVDGSTGTYYSTFVGEWIPAYGPKYGNIGTVTDAGKNILYVFAPELMVQYDQLEGGPNKYLLFSSRNQDLRIGPEAVLQAWSTPSPSTPEPLKTFLAGTSTLITFHESWDSYTGRNFMWAAASITYTFDALSGHFGVSASYGYGNSETTGNLTNQVKLGLSAKF